MAAAGSLTARRPDLVPWVERAAYHEAGHAVGAVRGGQPIIEVVLRTSEEAIDGYCDWGAWFDTLPSDRLYTPSQQVNAARAQAVAYLARPTAEARYLGLGSLKDCWRQDEPEPKFDVYKVETWLRKLVHPDDFESAASWLVNHACWLISQEWPAVERVAAALLERTVLSGDDVAELA